MVRKTVKHSHILVIFVVISIGLGICVYSLIAFVLHHSTSKLIILEQRPPDSDEDCPPGLPTKLMDCEFLTWKHLNDIGLSMPTWPSHKYCDKDNCSKCIYGYARVNAWKNAYINSTVERTKQISKLLNKIRNSSTIIVMTVNDGFYHIFLNWICSILANINDHEYIDLFSYTLIVTVDDKVINKLKKLNLPLMIHQPLWLGSDIYGSIGSDAESIGDTTFNALIALKIFMTAHLIDNGYNVLQMDTDIIWNKNALSLFNSVMLQTNVDVYMLNDHRMDMWGPGNAGFIFIRSHCKTKILMQTMIEYIAIALQGINDQGQWNYLLNRKEFRMINFQLLSDEQFINGNQVNPWIKTQKIMFNNTFYIFHASWTDNHYQKMFKFDYINHWYYTKSKCNQYFDPNSLPEIPNFTDSMLQKFAHKMRKWKQMQ